MTQNAYVVQQPALPAAQLILLLCDAGADPLTLRMAGEQLAGVFPMAMVVSVAAPTHPNEVDGFQWFPAQDISDEVLIQCVATARPAFAACIRHWQHVAGVQTSATALIGFGQGATMALEAAHQSTPLCSRVFAIAGRFASLPPLAARDTMVHFLHGKADAVTSYSHAVTAAHHLRDLGGDITAEVLPFIGHEMHPDFMDHVIHKLTSHVPKRLWTEALAQAAINPSNSTTVAM